MGRRTFFASGRFFPIHELRSPCKPGAGETCRCPKKIQALRILSAPTVTEDRVNSADELAAAGAEFADALLDYAFQNALAFGKKRNEHLATIFTAPRAADVAMLFQTIHELYRAVMADEQAVRERLDFGRGAIRHSANGKEHEVLLGLQAGGSRGGIAFAEK